MFAKRIKNIIPLKKENKNYFWEGEKVKIF